MLLGSFRDIRDMLLIINLLISNYHSQYYGYAIDNHLIARFII
jgi:hypothetical protein